MAELSVKASMPIVEGGILALNRETDLIIAEATMPANIELLEGMIINAPDNKKLRNYAAQAYYGYTYGFVEDKDLQRASKLYQRGLNHALYNLNKSGISNKILNGELRVLEKKLQTLDEENVAALFWAAANWSRWINHNRDKTEAIAELPKTIMLMQRVMELDEKFFMAGPHLFFAAYYGSRSPMLGGNFKLSEEHFNRAREINHNQLLLTDLLQAEFLDRQMLNQKAFHQRLTGIINNNKSTPIDFNLINQIAKTKARRLLSKESIWF